MSARGFSLVPLCAWIGLTCAPGLLVGQNKAADLLRLSAPHYQSHFPALDIPYYGVRVWDKNYLIAYAFEGTFKASPGKPAVALYDREGRMALQAVVWFKDAESVSIGDAAVSKAGKLLVSGGTHNHAGVVANFIAEIDDTGHVGRVIRTTPFRSEHICAADDGTVWSYGFDRDEKLEDVPGSLMLRQFSFDKGQLRAVLDEFRASDPRWLTHGRYPGEISLRCTSQKVGIYNAAVSEWAEFDIASNKLTVTKIQPLPTIRQMRITGFALTEAGDVFVSLHDRSSEPPRSGLFTLSLDSSGLGHWVPVKDAVGPYLHGAPVGQLLGTDGQELIYTRELDGMAHWSKYSK